MSSAFRHDSQTSDHREGCSLAYANFLDTLLEVEKGRDQQSTNEMSTTLNFDLFDFSHFGLDVAPSGQEMNFVSQSLPGLNRNVLIRDVNLYRSTGFHVGSLCSP